MIMTASGIFWGTTLNWEEAVRKTLDEKALIIRTAWLYSGHGNNFVKTMLNLMKEKPSLNVIDEQIGLPTWAYGLVHAIWTALEKKILGTFHWTDAGVASWYDFAVAIQEEGIQTGLLDIAIPILPVPTLQYPNPCRVSLIKHPSGRQSIPNPFTGVLNFDPC